MNNSRQINAGQQAYNPFDAPPAPAPVYNNRNAAVELQTDNEDDELGACNMPGAFPRQATPQVDHFLRAPELVPTPRGPVGGEFVQLAPPEQNTERMLALGHSRVIQQAQHGAHTTMGGVSPHSLVAQQAAPVGASRRGLQFRASRQATFGQSRVVPAMPQLFAPPEDPLGRPRQATGGGEGQYPSTTAQNLAGVAGVIHEIGNAVLKVGQAYEQIHGAKNGKNVPFNQ